VITPSAATNASPKPFGGSTGSSGVSVCPEGLTYLSELRYLVESESACSLPGVTIKYDTFIPAMWQAVSSGWVQPHHAQFVAEGLRYGFKAGVDLNLLHGHRWFKNYPSAIGARSEVTKSITKRVAAGKTIPLGKWSDSLGALVRNTYKDTFIFPMGAAAKKGTTEMRPTSDHSRTGLNAATNLDSLKHTLDTYNEIAWFLKRDYFMRVSDVDGAFTILPLHPDLWPFFLFRFFNSDESDDLTLYAHICGDFGAAGMPGVFKIFFVDVVVNMARAAQVLTLPMPVYVDDSGLIGGDQSQVDDEMLTFHAWAEVVCGVIFKAVKDRPAAQLQLMLGFWWDSRTFTRTLEESKLLLYLEMLEDFAGRPKLTLHDMQVAAGRMQRAVMTLPPGASCLLAGLFALMAGLKLPWHLRRLNRSVKGDLKWLHKLLSINMGRGFYSLEHFAKAPMCLSDASKSSGYTGGGWISQCGRYHAYTYGSRAARRMIDFLEGDTVLYCSEEMGPHWRNRLVPFGIDNSAFQLSLSKSSSKAPRLNYLIRKLFVVQLKFQCVIQSFWLASEDNVESDHLSRGRELEGLRSAFARGFWTRDTEPKRHELAGTTRVLPSDEQEDVEAEPLSLAPHELVEATDGPTRGSTPKDPFVPIHRAPRAGSLRPSLLMILMGLTVAESMPSRGFPFEASVPYDRTTLFTGLPRHLEGRLGSILDNRLSSSSWRTIETGVSRWKEVSARHGWSAVIPTGDPERGAKLVSYVLELLENTDLVFGSIENYVWGVRTWMKHQRQADPVYGVMGWSDFMSSVKVLSWRPAEPRRATPIEVVSKIIALIEERYLHDSFMLQMAFLILILLYTFSRSECPCPKTQTGRDAYDPEWHWSVCDFDIAYYEGIAYLRVRFKRIKQDQRVERAEARGDGDWAYVASIPGSLLCPFKWLKRVISTWGARRDPKAPFFMGPDGKHALTYSQAFDAFQQLQRDVGVSDDELSGLHGLRVEGYNTTKAGLGEDLTVAHGLWQSTAHKRYDRFALSRVLRIAPVIAGADPGDPQSLERPAGPPDHRLDRHSLGPPGDDAGASFDEPPHGEITLQVDGRTMLAPYVLGPPPSFVDSAAVSPTASPAVEVDSAAVSPTASPAVEVGESSTEVSGTPPSATPPVVPRLAPVPRRGRSASTSTLAVQPAPMVSRRGGRTAGQ